MVAGIALVERLKGRRLHFAIEVIGFSEEEGVRFGVPFIGSRAFIGDLDDASARRRICGRDHGIRVWIRAGSARRALTDDALGYLEFHIEQGPVLESLGLPLGIVEGDRRAEPVDVIFEGHANHAGTTPMHSAP